VIIASLPLLMCNWSNDSSTPPVEIILHSEQPWLRTHLACCYLISCLCPANCAHKCRWLYAVEEAISTLSETNASIYKTFYLDLVFAQKRMIQALVFGRYLGNGREVDTFTKCCVAGRKAKIVLRGATVRNISLDPPPLKSIHKSKKWTICRHFVWFTFVSL